MVSTAHSCTGILRGIPVTLRGLRIMGFRTAQGFSVGRSATVRHFYDAAHAPGAISPISGARYDLLYQYGQKHQKRYFMTSAPTAVQADDRGAEVAPRVGVQTMANQDSAVGAAGDLNPPAGRPAHGDAPRAGPGEGAAVHLTCPSGGASSGPAWAAVIRRSKRGPPSTGHSSPFPSPSASIIRTPRFARQQTFPDITRPRPPPGHGRERWLWQRMCEPQGDRCPGSRCRIVGPRHRRRPSPTADTEEPP